MAHREANQEPKAMAHREADQESEAMVALPISVRKKKRRKQGRIRKISLLDAMLTDDTLVEIFLRLHDSPTLFRCSIVCKRWFSIITSGHYRQQQLVRHRSLSQSFPFTLIFRVDDLTFSAPFCEFFCDERGQISSSEGYLDFLPWQDVHIYASYGDLLLLGRHDKSRFFIICNPFTKQWIKLPKPPVSYECYYIHGGLVLSDDFEPNNRPQERHRHQQLDQIRYKVMIIWHVYVFYSNPYKAMTFCSEAGEWSQRTQFTPDIEGHLNPQITPIASNGILHWVEQDSDLGFLRRLVAFDPFRHIYHPEHCRFIDFPSDFFVGEELSDETMVRLGLVQGRLRLSQLIKTEREGFVLKIWELSYKNRGGGGGGVFDGMWYLVRHVIEREWKKKRWSVIAFHHENVIFLLRGRSRIYRYNIEENVKERVGKFKKDGSRNFPWCLCVSTLVHPLWPTPISSLKF